MEVIPPQNIYVMLHEKLISNPIVELNKFCDFIGISPFPDAYKFEKANVSLSPVSALVVSLANKLLYPVCYIRNHKSKTITYSFPHTVMTPPEIEDLKMHIDNDCLIRTAENRVFVTYGARLIFFPFLKQFDGTLKNICAKLNIELFRKQDKQDIYRFFRDSNKRLGEFLGVDLDKYGY